MKKSVILAAALFGIGLLTACGSSSDPAYLSGIKAADYVELPDYSAIPVEAEMTEVSDDLVDIYVNYQLTYSTTTQEVTDRDEVRSGDIVNIDYVGKKDGEAFDGGTAEGYDLTIGSGTFIDGFEDGLIGCKVGETVDLDLTFPENYSSEELAGQDVVFTVTINSISESVAPELTDEWAASQGLEGVESVEDFREYIRSYLEEQAKSSYDSDVEDQVVTYLEENTTFKKEIPTELVDRLTQTYTDSMTSYASSYGYDLKTLMILYYGSDEDSYEQDIRNMAEETAKEYIILQAIADQEKLNPTDTEFNTALSNLAAAYGYTSVEDYKENEDEEAYKEYMMTENALDFLAKNAVVTAPTAEDTDSTNDAADGAEAEEDTADSTETAK